MARDGFCIIGPLVLPASAVPGPDALQVLVSIDGRVLAEHAVVWLPPLEVGTTIALGLNDADHVAELRNVDAMARVAGYTVCNDYAVRDDLENWYRPNLRVKSRDGGTVPGPWPVDAADVPDLHALALRTLVNGRLTPQGNTANRAQHIPALIEYRSSVMTLQAGDVILNGSPDGVVNVNVGDAVVTEIDGSGRLVNTLVDDARFGR